jgi:hypothetical protein
MSEVRETTILSIHHLSKKIGKIELLHDISLNLRK